MKLPVPIREFIGAFADLGVLLPLLIGLIVCNGVSAGPAIVLVGIAYILTGAYYRLPVPVQPMKAMAMIAIATGASAGEIRAAGYLMAAILLIIAATRIADKLNDVFPRELIQGIQLILGIMLVRTGVKFLLVHPGSLAGIVPSSQTLAGIGGIMPSLRQFQTALFLLVIPQLPLSIGNAILATSDCALKYFGRQGARVTPSRLAATMGIGNAIVAIGGGMPFCHGAGGMTAHYRLGARTGAAPIIIGSLLLAVGIWKGGSAAEVLALAPASILGILLLYVGIRHAMLAGSAFRKPSTAAVVLSMGIVGWFTGSLLVALAVGLIVKLLAYGLECAIRNPQSEILK